MKAKAKVGLLDSGAGGLTVLAAVIQQADVCDLHYFADDAFSPYGALPRKVMRQRVEKICLFLIEKGVNALVLACNTATVETIHMIRNMAQVKARGIVIIGIEPAVKPAALMQVNGVVTVLATPVTCQSERLQSLINNSQQVSSHSTRFQVLASDVLANAIDELPASQSLIEQELGRIKALMQDMKSTTLVLACTHYPLIKARFEQVCGPNVTIIEPSQAVAEQLCRRLPSIATKTKALKSQGVCQLVLYSSKDQKSVERLQAWLSSILGGGDFQSLDIELKLVKL